MLFIFWQYQVLRRAVPDVCKKIHTLMSESSAFQGCPDGPSRGLQDRAVALLLEERLRANGFDTEFIPVRHLIEPETMFVVPHALISQRGGFMPADSPRHLPATMQKKDDWEIWHMEVTFFKDTSVPMDPVGADVRDLLYYFPMAAYITKATDPSQHDFALYQRNRGPIGAAQWKAWSSDGLVRWCPDGHGDVAKWGTLTAGDADETVSDEDGPGP